MPDQIDHLMTLAAPGTAEQKISRSTFLAAAIPIRNEEEARAHIADQRRKHHDARHVCSAWRLGLEEGLRELRHDDGEPSGSAGEPILKAIRAANLTNTAVTVVRYFGGIKLGTGGLARAYGSTSAMALAAAPRRTVRLGRHGMMEFSYSLRDGLARLLAAHGGRIDQEQYTHRIRWRIWLPHSSWDGFNHAVVESTAGLVRVQSASDRPEGG
jgi:uncharacterized YigZ family protein